MLREDNTTAVQRTPRGAGTLYFLQSFVVAVGALYATVPCGTLAAAEAPTADDGTYEGPRPSWQVAETDAAFRVAAQERRLGEAHAGQGCEFLRLEAGSGTFVYAKQAVAPAHVIAELQPSVWIRSDRPGLQLFARAVLPKTRDPKTGLPLTALLQGSQYKTTGRWEQLTLRDAPLLLERQVRLLRAKYGSSVDARGAYVDLLVLNVYGGSGVTNVWIDDLEMRGAVAAEAVPTTKPLDAAIVKAAFTDEPGGAAPGLTGGGPSAAFNGSVLQLAGQPLFVQMVESNGESLEWLKSLGCNVIRLPTPPTDAELREAARLGVLLISPPPDPSIDLTANRQYDAVLAWDLGRSLAPENIAAVQEQAASIRQADSKARRPLLAEPQGDLRNFSRSADVLLVARNPLGTPTEMGNLRGWLSGRQQLVRPGTPLWTSVPTEPPPELLAQWTAWSRGAEFSPFAEPEQVRALAFTSLMTGSRGVCFSSRTRLDGSDNVSRLRAATLEWCQRELAQYEPWAAAGTNCVDLPTGDSQVLAGLIHHERADLLIALRVQPGQQYCSGATKNAPLSVVLPGQSDAVLAYRVFAGGVQPLRPRRVTGGMRIEIDEPSLVNIVVLTQDPVVVHHLSRRLAENEPRFAKLRCEVAGQLLPLVEAVDKKIPKRDPISPTAALLDDARTSLAQAERLLAAEDYRGATRFAERSLDQLARVRRASWEQAIRGFVSASASPGVASFASLPLHWGAVERLKKAQAEEDAIPGGDMENLEEMVRIGWQRSSQSPDGVRTEIDLSPQAPHAGSFSLRLAARPEDPKTPSTAFDTFPVWITSAPAPVRAGAIVRIHGWVRMPEAATGEGLAVFDSIGGPALGDRVRVSREWREVTLYRAVPRTGELRVTLALTGLGEVWADDFTITTLAPAPGAAPEGPDPVLRFPSE